MRHSELQIGALAVVCLSAALSRYISHLLYCNDNGDNLSQEMKRRDIRGCPAQKKKVIRSSPWIVRGRYSVAKERMYMYVSVVQSLKLSVLGVVDSAIRDQAYPDY